MVKKNIIEFNYNDPFLEVYAVLIFIVLNVKLINTIKDAPILNSSKKNEVQKTFFTD